LRGGGCCFTNSTGPHKDAACGATGEFSGALRPLVVYSPEPYGQCAPLGGNNTHPRAECRRLALFVLYGDLLYQHRTDYQRYPILRRLVPYRGWFQSYSIKSYIQWHLQYLFVLGWTIFYYFMIRYRKPVLSLGLWIMTLIPPVAAFFLLTHFMDTSEPLLEAGTNIYLDGFLFGLFFFASHHYAFYMYLRQMKLSDIQVQTQTLQVQLDDQIRQNRLIERTERHTEEVQQEMKNVLFELQIGLECQNYDGIRMRIAGLLGRLQQYEHKPYTVAPVIDAMISYKLY
jgi:hypothetical protein